MFRVFPPSAINIIILHDQPATQLFPTFQVGNSFQSSAHKWSAVLCVDFPKLFQALDIRLVDALCSSATPVIAAGAKFAVNPTAAPQRLLNDLNPLFSGSIFNQNRFHKDHRAFFLSSIGIFRDHRGSAAVSSAVIAPKRQCCFKTAYLFIYSMTFIDYCQEHVNLSFRIYSRELSNYNGLRGIVNIFKTSVCPLARVMRSECRKRGIKHLKVVYSTEQPTRPLEDPSISCRKHCICPPGTRKCTVRRDIPGSTAFVPSVVGLIIAGEVVKDLYGNAFAKKSK